SRQGCLLQRLGIDSKYASVRRADKNISSATVVDRTTELHSGREADRSVTVPTNVKARWNWIRLTAHSRAENILDPEETPIVVSDIGNVVPIVNVRARNRTRSPAAATGQCKRGHLPCATHRCRACGQRRRS